MLFFLARSKAYQQPLYSTWQRPCHWRCWQDHFLGCPCLQSSPLPTPPKCRDEGFQHLPWLPQSWHLQQCLQHQPGLGACLKDTGSAITAGRGQLAERDAGAMALKPTADCALPVSSMQSALTNFLQLETGLRGCTLPTLPSWGEDQAPWTRAVHVQKPRACKQKGGQRCTHSMGSSSTCGVLISEGRREEFQVP